MGNTAEQDTGLEASSPSGIFTTAYSLHGCLKLTGSRRAAKPVKTSFRPKHAACCLQSPLHSPPSTSYYAATITATSTLHRCLCNSPHQKQLRCCRCWSAHGPAPLLQPLMAQAAASCSPSKLPPSCCCSRCKGRHATAAVAAAADAPFVNCCCQKPPPQLPLLLPLQQLLCQYCCSCSCCSCCSSAAAAATPAVLSSIHPLAAVLGATPAGHLLVSFLQRELRGRGSGRGPEGLGIRVYLAHI